MWKAIDGYKNYLFAAGLFAIGLLETIRPDVKISILALSSPQDYFAAATMWALGRNALAKVAAPKQ